MSLFRMPKKGEYVRNDINGRIDTVVADWGGWKAPSLKDNYTLVILEITPVEPPPPPKVTYHNLYPTGFIPNHPGFSSREEADRGAHYLHTRIGCIKVTKGQFDD